MPSMRKPLIVVAAALALSACAGAEAQMSDLASGAEARSTCHTSSGQWIGAGRDCTVSYSISKTTTTTTTTTTVESAPASPALEVEQDES